MNSKASPYANGPTELRDIVNMNGATPASLTKRQGSTLYVGATVSGRISGGYEFIRLSGASYFIATANTNAYTVTSSFNAFKTGLLNGALFSFSTFVDRLFACNGQDFFKYDGANTTNYGLPNGATNWGVTAIVGGGLSGTFVASFGYLNDRGYFGPAANGITIALNGSTFGTIGYYGLTAPSGFGITALSFYRTNAGAVDLTGTTYAPASTVTANDTGWPLTTRLAPNTFYFTLVPKYLELFNNQLFMSGFSTIPSTVVWSQIGEPEGIEPQFSAEFRTNDGDRITGMKFYSSSLVVSKENSFHRIDGDNPSNFTLNEVSDQYGCLSHRAMVVFNDRLWFLDTKGIVEYNGANVNIVSNKVEDIFTRMNRTAARENAAAIHVKDANEVWFAIPIDGSTVNNAVVVYDYLSEEWFRYEGFNASSLFIAKGAQSKRVPFYGGYSGNLFNFGISLMGDNGSAITCMVKTAYSIAGDHTEERQWRRFYIDVDPVLGTTQAIQINMRTNYGSTIQLSRTMYQNPFQSRVDFGIPSRSIQAEIVHASATLPFKLNGYTFESRFQRSV